MSLDLSTSGSRPGSHFALCGAICLSWLLGLSSLASAGPRIAAVGDSITEGFTPSRTIGTTSYRQPLESKLTDAGCSYDMVGGKIDNNPPTTYQSAHEGYSGRWARNFVNGTSINPSITSITTTYAPNVILIHLGSNDIRLGATTDATLGHLRDVISRINLVDPTITVLLANVIPWLGANTSSNLPPFEGGNGIEGEIELLGDKIEDAIANGFPDGSTRLNFSNVYLVDVRDNYTASMMQSDLIHPNAAGEEHIAQKFFDVIDSLDLCEQEFADNIPPVTTISLPASTGDTVANTVELTGSATDEGGAGFGTVRIAIENLDHEITAANDRWYNFNSESFGGYNETTATLQNTTTSSTDWSITVTLPAGRFRLYALAVDNFGNQNYVDGVGVWPVNREFFVTPEMAAPAPGSVLSGTTETFEWTDFGNEIFNWELWVGSTPGGRQYHNSGTIAGTPTATVSDLPDDGSPVYTRLWYRDTNNNSPWKFIDREYSAYANAPIQILTPAPGSTMPADGSATFTWTPVDVAWLYVGSTEGGTQYFNSSNIGPATSASVTNLPIDGSAVYVRLWYKNDGSGWLFVDAQYTAGQPAGPVFTTPAPNTTLSSSEQTFSWTSVAEAWLYVGTTLGANDIHDSGGLGSATNYTIANLPLDSSTIYVRLWYRNIAGTGSWKKLDAQYTAGQIVGPVFTTPAPNTTLGASQTFIWTEVAEAWLYVGTSPGASDIHDSGNLGSASSEAVSNLPLDASTIYVRLWYRDVPSQGPWKTIDVQYTADTPNGAPILSPAANATFSSDTETFSWTPVGQVQLYVGTEFGKRNLYDSGSVAGISSITVPDLPTDGSTIYVRLWYRDTPGSGSWSLIDQEYTASGP